MTEPNLATVVFWAVTLAASWLTFVTALVVDLATRWGDVLVLEWHVATLVWVAAFILSRIAAGVVRANSRRLGVYA